MDKRRVLPVEVVSLITSYLSPKDYPKAALINKLFYERLSPLVWRTIKLKHLGQATKFIDALMDASDQLRTHIENLDIDRFEWTSRKQFQGMLKKLAGLKTLTMDIGHNRRSSEMLPELSLFCKKFKSISLRRHLVTQLSLDFLLQSYPDLRVLHLDHCHALGVTVISGMMARTRRRLESFKLHLVKSDHYIKCQIDLSFFPKLTYLELYIKNRHCFFDPDPTELCPRLQNLVLIQCFPFVVDGDDGDSEKKSTVGPDRGGRLLLGKFIKAHRDLESLTLDQVGCTDADLMIIASSCHPKGRGILDLAIPRNKAVTSRGVRQMVRRCSTLRHVYLHGCNIPSSRFPEITGNYADRHGKMTHLDTWAMERIRVTSELDDADNDDEEEKAGDDDDEEIDVGQEYTVVNRKVAVVKEQTIVHQQASVVHVGLDHTGGNEQATVVNAGQDHTGENKQAAVVNVAKDHTGENEQAAMVPVCQDHTDENEQATAVDA